MQGSIINQDLARWSPRQWFWAVSFFAVFQFTAIYYSNRPIEPRALERSGTTFGLPAATTAEPKPEWLELQDPMLFAGPNWHSVSALAWMHRPSQELAPAQAFPPIDFLAYHEGRSLITDRPLEAKSLAAAPRRSEPELTLPVLPTPVPDRTSTLAYEGFDGRAARAIPSLPAQYHNDYVSRSVVEAGVDPDGFVISTRLISSSGSKRADADAISTARTMRFEPVPASQAEAGEIAWGKLIFEWHALNLSPTNAVRR